MRKDSVGSKTAHWRQKLSVEVIGDWYCLQSSQHN